jgi:hypothetical protein
MTIKQITYKRHASDKPSYISFNQSGVATAIMARHEIFAGIAKFASPEQMKAEIEKRADGVGVIEVEDHLEYYCERCCGNVPSLVAHCDVCGTGHFMFSSTNNKHTFNL